MQHATALRRAPAPGCNPAAAVATLRIRDEPEDRPATRRKIIGACLFAAIAIHGALAVMPLSFGGSSAEYGIAPGDQIEVTLIFESAEPALAIEQVAIPEPPPPAPPLADDALDTQVAFTEEPAAAAPEAAPSARPIQQPRTPATASVEPKSAAARTSGTGRRSVAKPDYLRNPPPKYPAESRKLREEGVVLLKVSVTPEGRPADVQLQRSSGFSRLDEAALRAVRRWEFNPARVGVTAIACVVEVPVRFGLN